MTAARHERMTVDQFLTWAADRDGRWELVGGIAFAMSPARVIHGEVKFAVQTALKSAIGRSALNCFMVPDGATVRISEDTAFEPDALVYGGARLDANAIEVPHPVIVVEVASPSTRRVDAGLKLRGYFSIASVQHYLIIDPERLPLIHHQRQLDGSILTRLIGDGVLRLDPPGLDIPVSDLAVGS